MVNLALHRFAVLVAVSTLFLVIAGASVTSNQAGLSVPDWPLSYGQVMPEMKGGVFYEHGHRMIASAVGLSHRYSGDLALAHRASGLGSGGWVRCAVGRHPSGCARGMTVLFMLPKAVSISHACLAQLFFSTTVAIAIFTSPGWLKGPQFVEDGGLAFDPVAGTFGSDPHVCAGRAGRRLSAPGVRNRSARHRRGHRYLCVLMMVATFVLVQFPKHARTDESCLGPDRNYYRSDPAWCNSVRCASKSLGCCESDRGPGGVYSRARRIRRA